MNCSRLIESFEMYLLDGGREMCVCVRVLNIYHDYAMSYSQYDGKRNIFKL